MRRTAVMVLCVFLVTGYAFARRVKTDYSIVDYGAKSDTSYLSTIAIQKAIDACAAAGGGRVIVPAGQFKTGSLFLRDFVYLYLSPGATLFGSKNVADYIPVQPSYVSLRTCSSTIQLIYGENLHNTGICGEGTIDGQGSVFIKKAETDEGLTRPHLIRFITCTDITVRDVTLRNSGCWMQHYLACDNVKLCGQRIYNRATKNNDAVDIDGCHNVIVSDIVSDTDDDGITLKSTSPRLTENVTITNCVVSSHCNGIKMGTETNGGFRNITISNCVVTPSDNQEGKIFGYMEGISGISLEITDGGVMDGVAISNIVIRGTKAPLFVWLGNRARPYAEGVKVEKVGELKNVSISNVHAVGASPMGCMMVGLPDHPIENIRLSDVFIQFKGGVETSMLKVEPKESPESYPEATMFGMLPAYGFFIRHAKGIVLDNVELTTDEPDSRPAVVKVDAEVDIR